MSERVVLIRHRDDPADDRVASYFRARNIEPEIRRPFNGDDLGPVDGTVAASVVYGGPFNVFDSDKHPFLNDEHRWIEGCLANDVPLLGICQGAQSIAYVLGAEVGPKPGEPYEFGYYRIEPTEAGRDILPGPLYLAQSHYHEFQIPDGGERLAGSEGFANQAMRYGTRTYAFQFHAEVTRTGFRRWQEAPWANFGKPGAQAREEQDVLGAQHDQAQHDWFMGFLDRLFGEV
ncbi:MAG: glutamine amidotransferase [Paracoccaceae bacterium]|nr:glutamine amidotransferase [Paracoccaceae bacterium]